MSEDRPPYNSTATSSEEKDLSKRLTALGKKRSMLWVPVRVKSTPNLREHWSKKKKRVDQEKSAVRKALAESGLLL